MARRGSSSFIEAESKSGVQGGGGGEGILESFCCVCFGNWGVASGVGE